MVPGTERLVWKLKPQDVEGKQVKFRAYHGQFVPAKKQKDNFSKKYWILL